MSYNHDRKDYYNYDHRGRDVPGYLKFPDYIVKFLDKGDKCGSLIGKGWIDIVESIINDISAHDPNFAIHQIKEKFGRLRMYTTTESQECIDIINKGEILTITTCEICGAPGELSGKDWIVVRCEQHRKGNLNQMGKNKVE